LKNIEQFKTSHKKSSEYSGKRTNGLLYDYGENYFLIIPGILATEMFSSSNEH
jgi:hypothetical protein